MKRNRWVVWSLAAVIMMLVAIAVHLVSVEVRTIAPVQAQATKSPTAKPSPALPPVPIAPAPTATPAAPPASTAAPAAMTGTYTDPTGRFKVGILKNYTVSPLAGAVLIESASGNLAYTVVAQSQPLGNPIGLVAGYDNSEGLAKIATTVFQRGEGFQPALARPEVGGGAVMDWSGSLTIGGTVQPVSGVILVRPTTQTILLLLIAATEAGKAQVPSALSALASSLAPLQ